MNKNRLYLFYLILFSVYLIGGFTAILLSYTYHFNREGIGIAILLGAVVSYLLLRKKEVYHKRINLNKSYFKVLCTSFTLLIIPALLISSASRTHYYLPTEFFIIISIMAGIITAQILFFRGMSKLQSYSILIEIFVLSIILSSAFLFLFPSHSGNDASFHVLFIQTILNTGNIDNFMGQYANYPIFHLLFVSFIYLTGIHDFKIIQFILASIILLFLTFIFILIKNFSNERIALLAILLISTIPYIIQGQYTYFPMTFSIIFFILGLYLFLNANQSMMMTILFILSFITLNLSHPLTPLFFIIISSLILIISKETIKKKYLSVTGIALLVVLMLSWWMKPIPLREDLLSYFLITVRNAFESVDPSNIGSVTLSSVVNFYSMGLYDLGWVILSFLGVIGAFYGVKKIILTEKPKNESLYFFIIALILIPLPYVLAIIYPQSLPDRWFTFTGLFIGISASFGVFAIFKCIGNKRLANVFLVFLVVTGIFFNITTPIVNINSHIYSKELSTRSALTSSELNSVNFLNAYSNIKDIKGNSVYLALAYRNISSENYIDPSNFKSYSNGTIIVRNYDLKKGFTIPLYGSKGALLKIIQPNAKFMDFLNNSNEVYNNGNLKMYYN